MPAIDFSGVARRYSKSVGIGPLDFAVPEGSAFGLIGSNGAGKTTTMRMLTGLEASSSGDIRVLGSRVTAGRLPVGVTAMIEEPRFYGWLSGSANLVTFALKRAPSKASIRAVLEEVGLDHAGDRPVDQYSQGMRQRLGIARVLLADTPIMIFDEPTNGLDPVGIRWFRDLVSRLTGAGKTVVLSSHLLHEVQRACSDYLMLASGKMLSQGSVTSLGEFVSLEDLYYQKMLESE